MTVDKVYFVGFLELMFLLMMAIMSRQYFLSDKNEEDIWMLV